MTMIGQTYRKSDRVDDQRFLTLYNDPELSMAAIRERLGLKQSGVTARAKRLREQGHAIGRRAAGSGTLRDVPDTKGEPRCS